MGFDYIKKLREDSNIAISNRDIEMLMSSYVEDIVVISAEGRKLIDKDELKAAWTNIFRQKGLAFERLSDKILLSKDKNRAWESGKWRYSDGSEGGEYAAMWISTSDGWKIRSELFVGLK